MLESIHPLHQFMPSGKTFCVLFHLCQFRSRILLVLSWQLSQYLCKSVCDFSPYVVTATEKKVQYSNSILKLPWDHGRGRTLSRGTEDAIATTQGSARDDRNLSQNRISTHGLQTASEVDYDLGNEIYGLNYLCNHASLVT